MKEHTFLHLLMPKHWTGTFFPGKSDFVDFTTHLLLVTLLTAIVLRVYTTITRSIDFLYKLRSLLGALSRKKSWFAYINLV